MRPLGIVSLLLLLGLPHALVAAHEEVGSAEVPALIASLCAGDPGVRTQARDTLLDALLFELPRDAVFSESVRPAIADVQAALRSDDITIRVLAASAASRMGLHARPLLDDLFASFGAGVFAFDYQVLEAVRKLGPEAVSVAPQLAAATHAYAEWSWEASSKDAASASGRDVASANRAALSALRSAGLDALRGSMEQRRYVRPAVRAQLDFFEKRFGPAEGEAPPNPAHGSDPVAPPAAWLARIEADVAAHGAPHAPGARRHPRDRSWPSLEELYALGDRAVPALTFALSHGTEAVRTTCLDVLAGLGSRAQSAGDALFALVSDADVQTRAARALGTSGATDIAWLDTLLPLLDAKSSEIVRLGVTRTLGRMGPAAHKARPALLDALDMSPPTPTLEGIPVDAQLRDATIVALGQIGGPPDELVPALLIAGASGAVWRPWLMPHGGFPGPSWERPRERSVRLRVSAAKAIGGLGVPALPAVRAGLASDDPAVRATAAAALAYLPAGAIGKSAIVASRDEDAGVRRAALAALQAAADTPAVRALMARIADTDSGVAAAAIDELGKLGARAEAAAADLAKLVVTGSAQARAALAALEGIRPDVETLHAPTLVSAMAAGTLRARDGVWRLRQLGPGARAQAPRLVAALADMGESDQRVALAYLTAEAADEPTYRPALRRLAAQGSPAIRLDAVRRLAHLESGRRASRASSKIDASVPTFAALVDDSDEALATAAATALADAAPKSEAARGELRTHLDDARESIRAQAVRGVAQDAQGEVAADAALALLVSKNTHVRVIAVRALTAIGEVDKALPTLRRMLTEEKAHPVRMHLLAAIASTGVEGIAAVRSHLRGLRGDKMAWLRGRNALMYGRSHVVPELRKWLKSKSIRTYLAGASMLRDMGTPARPAVPDLFELADTGRDQALLIATEALFALLGPDEHVLPLVERSLRADVLSRNMAVRLLPRMGPKVREILPSVAGALPRLRGQSLQVAVDAVADLGADAAPGVPALLASLPGAASYERAMILRALSQIAEHTETPRAALRWGLDDPTARVRRSAARGLIERFRNDAAAIERVGALLFDPDESVRTEVARRLAAIGADARPALPALVRAAETGTGAAMRGAFQALSELQPGSRLLRPLLLRLARSADAWRARAALAALGWATRADAEVGALLAASAKNWDWRVRLGAREGLAARNR